MNSHKKIVKIAENFGIIKSLRSLRALLRSFLKDRFNDADIYCKGDGIEIGALSVPYKFKKANVTYADIMSAEDMRNVLNKIPINALYPLKLVKPEIILEAPYYRFNGIKDNCYDFIYSSHVLEHHPNFLAALKEQIRIIKVGGAVYIKLPNKFHTYDRYRDTTPASRIIERYENNEHDYCIDDALDILNNTYEHPNYTNRTLEEAKRLIKENDGTHHFFTYDTTNLLTLMEYAQYNFNARMVYFRVNGMDIHICLQKNE